MIVDNYIYNIQLHGLILLLYYATFHDKPMHNAPKIIFEIRPPLPTTIFELLLLQI